MKFYDIRSYNKTLKSMPKQITRNINILVDAIDKSDDIEKYENKLMLLANLSSKLTKLSIFRRNNEEIQAKNYLIACYIDRLFTELQKEVFPEYEEEI